MCRSRCRRVAKVASAVPWRSDHRHGQRTGGPPSRACRHSPVPRRPHRGPYSRRPSRLRRSSLRQRAPLDSVASEQFQTPSLLLRGQHSQLERRRWLCNEFVTQCRAAQLAPERPVHDLRCGRSAEPAHVRAGQGENLDRRSGHKRQCAPDCPASPRDQDRRRGRFRRRQAARASRGRPAATALRPAPARTALSPRRRHRPFRRAHTDPGARPGRLAGQPQPAGSPSAAGRRRPRAPARRRLPARRAGEPTSRPDSGHRLTGLGLRPGPVCRRGLFR